MNFGNRFRDRFNSREPLWKRLIIWTILGALGLGIAGLVIFTLTVGVLSLTLPDVRDFDKLAGVESTVIYDRDGGALYTIHGEENRKYVPLSEISPNLQKATIAIEDDQFYEHSGFDLPGIAKAVAYKFLGIGRARGGSTITQQLAKNAFLSPQRSLLRKAKELILAIRLEHAYDKNKILELYLNRIPYGNNAYGAELASRIYFGKSARDLTLGESAILASLPQAPTLYSPYGPNLYSKLERTFGPNEKLPKTTQDLDRSDYTLGLLGKTVQLDSRSTLDLPGRSDVVLKRMSELGFITEEERTIAENEVHHIEFKTHHDAIRAAHFVFEIRRQLEERFGKDIVAQGGLQVFTTLDPKIQDAAEQALADQIKISKDAHGASTGAVFSINPKTGEVLAMVGSADYFDTEAHGNVNHVFARRQPGSSFKPIVYAKAFLNRYAPGTVIYDTPTDFGGNYIPQNFEGGFKGPLSIRQALGQSRNIPALKAYFLAGQQDEIIDLAQKMGITTLQKGGDYGPPLAIGAGEVRLADMVQAFSVFANTGIRRDYYSIFKVVDREGTILYERKPEENIDQQVLDPQVAYLINNVLSDKSVYLGPRLDVAGHTTAVKTGTSNKEITPVKILPSNLWTMGYTPSLVTGVWVGNSDGSPLKATADGYNVAAPVWSKVMTAGLAGSPDEPFPVPEGIKNVTVSKASGLLPSADTPQKGLVSEVFASFSVPTEVDSMYKQLEVNDLDDKLPNEFTPQEHIKKKVFIDHHDPIVDYPKWLDGIKDWVAKKRKEDSSYPDFPPTETTTLFTADTAKNQPTVQIVSPAAFSVFTDYVDFPVYMNINAANGVDKILFFFDDRSSPSGSVRKNPYEGRLRIPKNLTPGSHTITARLYDKVGYTAEAKIEIGFQPQ